MKRDQYFPENAWDNERRFYAGLGDTQEMNAAAGMIEVTPSGVPTRQAETPWYESLFKAAVPALTTAYAQNQMTKLNISRINQGMAPFSAAEYAAVYQPPSAQVQVGPTQQATKMLMFGGLAILALVGLRAAKVI
jgi:hypothetical protein